MNDYQLLDHHAKNQDWDKAIAVAHKLRRENGFQMLATQEHPIPPSHIEKFLKHAPKDEMADVVYNLAGNLHPDLSRNQLRHIWTHSPNEQYSTQAILAHPSYTNAPSTQEEESEKHAGKFWNSYEAKVEPSHFAAIKAMYTGEPEHIETHRNDKGHSDTHKHQIPHLVNHMHASQKAVMDDENIPKKMINGEPHVTVYRGVGGSYAKTIKDALGVQDHEEQRTYHPSPHSKTILEPVTVTKKASKVDRHKTVKIPSAHMSSWSLDENMAKRFATGRGEHDSADHPHHIIIKTHVPVRDILHTGMHSLYPGHSPFHENEQELVVAHPEGSYKVSSKDIEVGHPQPGLGVNTDFEAPKKVTVPKPSKPALGKSESCFESDTLEKADYIDNDPNYVGQSDHPKGYEAQPTTAGPKWGYPVGHSYRQETDGQLKRIPKPTTEVPDSYEELKRHLVQHVLSHPHSNLIRADQPEGSPQMRARYLARALHGQGSVTHHTETLSDGTERPYLHVKVNETHKGGEVHPGFSWKVSWHPKKNRIRVESPKVEAAAPDVIKQK